MQFARMNARNDLALNLPPFKQPVKQNGRTRSQHPPKSTPPDAEDLRRRLNIVLADQNAQREMRRQLREKAAAVKLANNGALEPSLDTPSPPAGIDATVTSVDRRMSTTSLAARAAAPARKVVFAPPQKEVHSVSSSNRDSHGSSNKDDQDGLQRADSKMEAGAAKDPKPKRNKSFSFKARKQTTTEKAQEEEEPYHHVPQVAAKQFVRTASVNTSLHDMSQKQALRRAQSTRDQLYERNQFQKTSASEQLEGISLSPSRNKRHSLPFMRFSASTDALSSPSAPDSRSRHRWNWANMGDIVEDTPATHDDYHHYRYQSGEFATPPKNQHNNKNSNNNHRYRRSLSLADLIPNRRSVNANGGEPLMNVADHRVDWTQKDEKPQPQSNNNSKVPRSPLLRKTDSLWALRGKWASGSSSVLHSWKHHRTGGNNNNSGNNKNRGNSTISESSTNSSEAEMTSPPPPVIKSSLKVGFFARLRGLNG